jgi:hypothetical protein
VPKNVKEKLRKGEVNAQQAIPVCVLKWSDKRNVTMIFSYDGAEVQIIAKQGKKNRSLCVRFIITNTCCRRM